MNKYQWNSLELKKKNNLLGWLALGAMALALVCTVFLVDYLEGQIPYYVALGFMVMAGVFLAGGWKVQSDDKKLKK